jgi:SAM-dependent methyltransferase
VAKAGEKKYFEKIGEAGRRMTVQKPFSDSEAGSLLAQIGTVIALLPKAPAKLLDLGCGSGWTTNFFAQCGMQATGQDIAAGAIKLAKKHFSEHGAKFICTDYENLSYKNSFDVAVFFDSLHHAEDVEAALKATHKSLKPGGKLIVSEPGKGHAKSPHSIAAMEEYGVLEQDMPPSLIIMHGRAAGFTSWRVYPDIGFIQRALVKDQFNRSILKYIPGSITRYLAVQYLLLFKRSFQGIVVLYKD